MLYPEFYDPFENFFDPWFSDRPEPPHRPSRPAENPHTFLIKTDIKETDSAYELLMDLPGIKKENLKAELHEGYLNVTAFTEPENKTQETGKYLRRERFSGTYSRSFYVGENVTEEDIQAKYTDGVLKLIIPKKAPAEPEKKQIAIQG